jgi:hypothetical protein
MEETTESKPSLFQNAIRWGVIFGIVSITLTIIAYVVDYSLLANLKFGLFIIAVLIGAVIYAGITYRKSIGGFIPYGKAFQHGFVMLAISGIISTLFTIVLYTVIDTELPKKLADVSIENAQKMMEGFGMPEDQMEKALDDARKNSENQFSALGLVKGYGFLLIFYAIISLITSLFVRRNQPEEMI